MDQRTRTGTSTGDTGSAGSTGGRARRGGRAGVAAALAAVALATLSGCFSPPRPNVVMPSNWPSPSSSSSSYNPYDPTPSYTPGYDTYSPSPSPTQETFDPDGRSDVRGSGCDFSASLRRFTYTLSITNPSTTSTYSYDMRIDWMKDKPADGTTYGVHERSVVVAPGATETYTATYTLNQSSWQAFWYTCQITRAHKTKM
ncbi:hypothetical protein ADL22_31190 [Streptomyces sp. NRRL F-4489]|uniref:hypothetical protein n=1 Tax=Streptomyces sp. NRRL F-4489 TaxID=1609095 RepID=UPI00074A4742|nr:hypothetical protein [Streptomyces sp. NRRL F-4489]KUL34095.1 hypothetical protein ADL22_31190 [Streptomyces sp. NRRL F-4489]